MFCLVSDKDEQAAEKDCAESKKRCEEWVNLSSFLARCIAAGVHHKSDDFSHVIHDIKGGLENDGVKRRFGVMVAAQYLLLAPRPIYETLVKYKESGLGLEKWQVWAKRFKEMIDKDNFDTEVIAMTKEARERMIAFDPSLFFVSERGNKADS